MAARLAFGPETDACSLRGEHGHAALIRWTDSDGRTVLSPADRMWRFGCPIVGADARLVVREVLDHLVGDPTWALLAVSGLRRDSELWNALLVNLRDDMLVGLSEPTSRLLIDLDGDYEQWLGRRSRKFRAGLRNASRRAVEAGVHTVAAHGLDPATLLERILAVETCSWKLHGGTGLNSPSMATFYSELVHRVDASDLRLWLAQRDGADVGYVLGALSSGVYRGLQQSFDDRLAKAGIGNLLAIRQLGDLATEGVELVDLGMPIDYKARWADREDITETLVLQRPDQ